MPTVEEKPEDYCDNESWLHFQVNEEALQLLEKEEAISTRKVNYDVNVSARCQTL